MSDTVKRLQARIERLEKQLAGTGSALVDVLCPDGHLDICLAGFKIQDCKPKCAQARAALEELFAQASFVFPADADFMQRARAALVRPAACRSGGAQ